MKRSQTATEYLIILAVVIVIGLIVVGVLGGIPSIGGGAGRNADAAELRTNKIGVMGHTLNSTSMKLLLRNNMPETISLDALTIENTVCSATNLPVILSSGRQTTIVCTNVNSSEAAGTQYEYDLAINYTDITSKATYTLEGLTLVGVVSGSAASGGSGFSGWCYQETANESHASDGDCGLSQTGVYSFSGVWDSCTEYLHDGVWSGVGGCDITGPGEGFVYTNYTIPSGANASSKVQYKYGSQYQNISFVNDQSCFYSDTLQLLFQINGADPSVTSYCYNGSVWLVLNLDVTPPSTEFYEEAMWWYIE